MVTMSIIVKQKKSKLSSLAHKAGRLAGYLSYHVPKAASAAGTKAKGAYERSISAYKKSIVLLEKAKREQARLKRLARKGRKALKGKRKTKRKATQKRRRR